MWLLAANGLCKPQANSREKMKKAMAPLSGRTKFTTADPTDNLIRMNAVTDQQRRERRETPASII